MANTIITSVTATSLTARIENLQYSANQYDEFSLVVYKNDVQIANPHWTSTSSNNYTSYTVTGLEPNTLYYVEGYAKWSGTWYLAGSDSVTTNQLNPPSTPTNLRCTYKDYEKVTLEWDASTGADGYKIYLDGSYVGSVSTTTSTIYGLNPNTTYQFCVSAYNADGESGQTCINVTTNDGLPSTPSAPTLYNNDENYRYEGGFRVEWGTVSNADSYTLKVRRGYDNVTTTYTTTNTYYDVTGLQYGVTYYVSVKANNTFGSSSYSLENPITTRPKKPTLTVYETGDDYIKIQVSGIEGNWTKAYVNIYNQGSSTYFADGFVTSNGGIVTFTGLSSNTTYEFDGRTWFDLYGNNSVWLTSFYTNKISATTNARPQNWSWSTTYNSGNTMSTYESNGKLYAIVMNATEWNSFTDRINQFRRYVGLSDYPFTIVSSGQNFTASIFNEAINAINEMNPPISPPSLKSSGDIVTAYIFNQIRDALNSIP